MKDYNKNYSRNNNKQPRKEGDNQAVVVSDKYSKIQAIQAQPLQVRVYGSNFEKALKAFRALVQKERVLSTFKEKSSYEKPSDKKRRKRNEAERKVIELSFKASREDKLDRKNKQNKKYNKE